MIIRFYNGDMPRVSPEHRAAQRRRILDAARRCFVREGFHATSMQDILAEAGLSAGGVYVYFKSKEEIVETIARDAFAVITGVLDGLLRGDDLPALDAALGRALTLLVAHDREQPTFRIAMQVWGEVERTPRLAALVAEVQEHVGARFTRLVERYQTRGELDPDIPAAYIAQVLIALFMGFVARTTLFGVTDVPAFQTGLRVLLAGSLRSTAK
jgi:AcrR family transcriptional regulator